MYYSSLLTENPPALVAAPGFGRPRRLGAHVDAPKQQLQGTILASGIEQDPRCLPVPLVVRQQLLGQIRPADIALFKSKPGKDLQRKDCQMPILVPVLMQQLLGDRYIL